MGRHRAPDDGDEPLDEQPDDDFASEDVEDVGDVGDVGGYREPPGPPADEPSFPGSFPAPRSPGRPPEEFSDDLPDGPGFYGFDEPGDSRYDEFASPDLPEPDLPVESDPPDDFPDFARHDPAPPPPPSGPPTGGHRGLPGFSGGP